MVGSNVAGHVVLKPKQLIKSSRDDFEMGYLEGDLADADTIHFKCLRPCVHTNAPIRAKADCTALIARLLSRGLWPPVVVANSIDRRLLREDRNRPRADAQQRHCRRRSKQVILVSEILGIVA